MPSLVDVFKRPNLSDIATLANVSRSTAQRAFTADSSISEAKRSKVLKAAAQLGYRPNALARSLRTTRTGLVGILMEEFSNPLFLSILGLLTRKLQENGLRALAVNATKDVSIDEAMDLIMQYRIDGLVVSSDMPLAVEYECSKMNVPVVSFARSDRNVQTSFGICLDDFHAGWLAGKHLAEKGYTRPGFIGGFRDVSVTQLRLEGFRQGLADAGLTISPVVEYAGDNTYKTGREASRKILSSPRSPDALFCVNDQVAIAAIDTATVMGRSVPNSLGVVGVDDIWFSETERYQLTTIRQPLEIMADEMVEVLANGSESLSELKKLRTHKGVLISRGSTEKSRS